MIGYLLLAAAALLLLLALRLRRATGIPWTRVRATDTGAWRPLDTPLRSQRFALVGKPDYLLDTRDGTVPVEVKPSRHAPEPYESDVLQLAAYCLLLEDAEGRAPRYGLLRYAERTFRVAFTPELRARLLDTLDAIRADAAAQDVDRSHRQPGRCRACGFWEDCEQRL